MNKWTYIIIFLSSVLLASISQIMLKKSAMVKHKNLIKEYLNIKVIFAYILFFGCTFLTVFAYKGVSLSLAPLLEATGYIYIALLSGLFLNEKITVKKLLGNGLIILGIIIFIL